MDLDELTLGQIKELRGLFGTTPTVGEKEGGDIRIVILQRGWVMVGRYFRESNQCRLENAYVIRRWGTTEGLGELASNGPTKETKLEPTPLVKFHQLTEIANITCEAEKWTKQFK